MPGVTKVSVIKKHTLNKVPVGEEWKVPLLHSLVAVKAGDFEIPFDDQEVDEPEQNIAEELLVHIFTS